MTTREKELLIAFLYGAFCMATGVWGYRRSWRAGSIARTCELKAEARLLEAELAYLQHAEAVAASSRTVASA